MLILTRTLGESFVVKGNGVTFKVKFHKALGLNRIELAIEADTKFIILRSELL